jgi:hypothetical protein
MVTLNDFNKFILIEIFSFLCTDELIISRQVNKYFNEVILKKVKKNTITDKSKTENTITTSNTSTSTYIEEFEDSTLFTYLKLFRIFRINNKLLKNYLKHIELMKNNRVLVNEKYFWLLNIISFSTIIILDLVLIDDCVTCINILNIIRINNPKTVKCMKLPFNVFKTEELLTPFTSLNELTVKHLHYHSYEQTDKIYLILNLLTNTYIEKLQLNGIKFMTSDFLNDIKNEKITHLDIRESSMLRLDNMTYFVNKHKDSLISLKIDGENTSGTSILSLISKLLNLEYFYVSYCESLGNFLFTSLLDIAVNLKKLSLRKIRSVNADLIEFFFLNKNYCKLLKLDLFDCIVLNDSCLKNISVSCVNLEYLDVSWSAEISNNGLILVINSLFSLKKLICQGLKKINDDMIKVTLSKHDE